MATAALNAYSSAAAIPVVGYIIAPIAAAMAVAAGMMQVAAIKKQQQASQAQGYAERGALHAVTTHKPKVERSIAVTNRVSTFYNQQDEKEYEVETSGLTMELARWIEQLFYSHDVRMATKRTDLSEDDFGNYNPQYMPIVLITDFTCEIHDEDGELNTVKFTYQCQDRRTYLPTDYLSVDHERIFTAPFNPTYN